MYDSKEAEKNMQRRIAVERIRQLFREAEKLHDKRPDLCSRYAELSRKISMKFKVPFPDHIKRRFCRKCSSFLFPGKNCRIRSKGNKIVYYCLQCKNYTRIPIKKPTCQ